MSGARFLVSIAVGACVLGAASRARAQGGRPASPEGETSVGTDDDATETPTAPESDLDDLDEDVRVIPRGPTIPDLQHTAAEASFEQTIVSVKPNPGVGPGGAPTDDASKTSHVFETDFEIPILQRKVYLGGQWAFAGARSPGQPESRFVAGQPELFARIVHASPREEYALGAGLGLMPPVFTYDDVDDAARVRTASPSTLVGVVRPWDLAMFLDRHVTARPWIDLRIGRNKIIAQVRQGLDVAVRTSVPSSGGANVGDVELIAITALYVGWQPVPELAVGLEAWDIHLVKTQLPISDRDRTAFVLSPCVRFFHRTVEPGLSLVFPIGAPLLGDVDRYVAMRIDLRVWFGR
jgi:hypothetical protein